MIEFAAPPAVVSRVHAYCRQIHRLLLELARGRCSSLADITALVDSLDISRILGPEQSFAVRAQRRGDHSFESPDVESAVGQAIVDASRAQRGTRPPVDLDDPDLIVRVFVRERRAIVTVDTTGQYSLHRRRYRVAEHAAPIRPTMAASMYRLADPDPDERVVDPLCGCGTVPIEAAATALDRRIEPVHEPAFRRLRALDADESAISDHRRQRDGAPPDIRGFDIDPEAVADARENARHAGVADTLSFETADARQRPIAADVVVTDLPFGVRTDDDIRPLYADFAERLAESDCRRAVIHTARGDLLGLEPTRRIEMRRGRLETAILVID
nr:THUMP domain-containing protein [Halovenus carboxidivorans]